MTFRHGQSPPPVPPDLPWVAVVEDDAVLLTGLVTALDGVPGVRPFTNLDEVLDDDAYESASGVVLVLGPSQVSEALLDRVAAAVQVEAATAALVVVEQADAATLRLVVRSGLRDAIPVEAVSEDLGPAVVELQERLRGAVSAARPPGAPDEPARPPGGRVVTVYSPKGGVGKSVVAVNLATLLARDKSRRVVLVDFDLQFGDTALMLRLKPDHDVSEAATADDRLDTVLLENLLTRDDRTGLRVLAAPPDPTRAEKVTAKTASALIELLRSVADYIVVDTAPILDDTTLQVLSESDDIVYVVGMDVPSVKNARLGLQALELVQVPLRRVLLVLNRADSRVHLAVRDVERSLRMKVDAALPSDALVPQSVNRGTPAVLEFERSRFTGRMREIVDLLLARAASKEPR